MKLIRASFKNFRLLKDLELNFSIDERKPLTVIRAANETGKTTCQYALIWALYGSKYLPNRDYALFPADLKSQGIKKVNISVEVEFQVEEIRRAGKKNADVELSHYMLKRSCVEHSDKDVHQLRQSDVVSMFRVTNAGTEPVSPGEVSNIINNALPASLKDVYFTDGDSAMSFIEAAATPGVKRKRVSNAVESLLGLEILKATVRHMENVSNKFSEEIDDTDYSNELEKLNDRISSWEEDIDEWEKNRVEYEQQETDGKQQLKQIQANIEESLKLGDKSKLASDIKLLKGQIERVEKNSQAELNQLALLSSDENVSKIFLEKSAKKAFGILENLSAQKQLPKVNIPILEELLDANKCFCGSDLSDKDSNGQEKRNYIRDAIEKSRESDLVQEVATSLFYRARSVDFSCGADKWKESYVSLSNSYQNSLTTLRDLYTSLNEQQISIDSIDNSQLTELRNQEKNLLSRLLRISNALGEIAAQIDDASQRRKEAEEERTKVESKLGKNNKSGNKLRLAREGQQLFEKIIERLKKEELTNVSSEMNRIFMEMIGSTPEENDYSLITGAKLTEDYDIIVFGPGEVLLNPDQDLNGASRRAITLAFILALTKVSQVEAPNVIDTPLGMTSGFVKQSILKQTIAEGTQAVLFLTHDEIKGVESLINKYAGEVYTLTNPAHYPRMLANKPNVEDARIIRCSCDHLTNCEICERKDMEVI